MPSWINGRPAETLPVTDRGLAYGDGLFETIAVKAGRPLLFERHLQRLATGCSRLAIAADQSLIRSELLAFAAQLGEGVMKLILTRGDSLRGYAPAPMAEPRRILQGGAAPAYPAAHAEQGICLFECLTRLSEQPLLAGLKHLNRLEQVLARSEWQDSAYAEGLMCDTSGRIIDGVYSNVFLIKEGVLLTADLSRCGVAGVMRAELLAQARTLGIGTEERDIQWLDLEQADEVFLSNSVYGVWPVRGVARLNWPVGPLTRKLQGIARALLDV
ncbi:aminodeoxychorismate lyase [Pseudomonas sp. RTC3]|uniref:aminodeoxychorismate lyase n=1 Tax=Pseudomonas sp. 5C2 TaxID=3048588 RepID=UPI002AB41F55|nr:aminodeoxychorismate lyase [Pseudomonas sp. 5C2]MDY7565907.1 aminodeoxychorismate lyase [Pseudomonas sp. 5C2]MEB0064466.1 aminodeoxychorismate lyase [Pseudomonas sp. RTC3]MEB0242968.1 aminodeoxychorismate lyase [Pseudomonas sp. 5C2]